MELQMKDEVVLQLQTFQGTHSAGWLSLHLQEPATVPLWLRQTISSNGQCPPVAGLLVHVFAEVCSLLLWLYVWAPIRDLDFVA